MIIPTVSVLNTGDLTPEATTEDVPLFVVDQLVYDLYHAGIVDWDWLREIYPVKINNEKNMVLVVQDERGAVILARAKSRRRVPYLLVVDHDLGDKYYLLTDGSPRRFGNKMEIKRERKTKSKDL